MDQHPEGNALPGHRADDLPLPLQDETLGDASTAAGRIARLYAGILAGQVQDVEPDGEISTLVTEVTDLGLLELPGGLVIAWDLYLTGEEHRPFTRRLPCEHPRAVAAACCIAGDHWRNLALLLVAGEGPVVRWVGGRHVEEDTEDEDSADCYPVDTGVGCFASPAAVAELDRVMREDDGMLEDPISRAMEESGTRHRTQAVIAAPSPGALPVAACHSGWGDGVYATWFGLDQQGRAIIALTDFDVIIDPEDEVAEPPSAEARDLVQRAIEEEEEDEASGSTPAPAAHPGPVQRARSAGGALAIGIIVNILMVPVVLLHLRSGGLGARDILVPLAGLALIVIGLVGRRRRRS